ncbi:hypothetical protein [Pontibacillus yanchengensis]|uniref:Uncharacterized protein n=1 Tax=Pontibacillus yanchengensis Y32 TaxID=1385514 RepID=A0A0A2T6Y3_9BACI|nr:hypothetical protein [Pontibacillus yanchengensis]KGP71259.1 hypothetical protein N782_20410 [Pontibacillus yanchengensis Y32]
MHEFDVNFVLTNSEVDHVMMGESSREVNDKLCKKLSSNDPTLQLGDQITILKSHIQYFRINQA